MSKKIFFSRQKLLGKYIFPNLNEVFPNSWPAVLVRARFSYFTGFDCNAVYLTVSSLWRPSPHGRGLTDRDLELNWESSCDTATLPQWVGLFDTNPSSIGKYTSMLKKLEFFIFSNNVSCWSISTSGSLKYQRE